MAKKSVKYLYATKEDVGKIAVPADNSDCIKFFPIVEDGYVSRRICKIISMPFDRSFIPTSGVGRRKTITREFVIINIEGELFIVNNRFSVIGDKKTVGINISSAKNFSHLIDLGMNLKEEIIN